MLRAYRSDRAYLYCYYRNSTLVLALVIALLAALNLQQMPFAPLWLLLLAPLALNSILGIGVSLALLSYTFIHFYGADFSLTSLVWIPAGIYLGMINVQLIHNCAHKSFRPLWINRPLGELLAIHLLSGFPGFVILHLTHHRYPDDPALDPHPNGDLSFWEYFFSIKKKLKEFFRTTYFAQWGETLETKGLWRRQQLLLPLNRVLRAGVMLLVFGPTGFLFFIVPSLIANHITYAHINYFTHQRQADGSVAIINLDTGFYRILNFFMLGGYSHKNHHDQPQLFNPARLPQEAK